MVAYGHSNMSSKGSSPSGQSTTTSQVPSYAQPYVQNALNQSSQLYQAGGPQYFPGNQVAPFSPLQEQGFSQIQNTATGPQNLTNAANQNFTNLESGSYLNPASNPSLQGVVGQADQQIQNNLTSQFAGSGRNIEASAPVQASQMGQVAQDIYGGAYNNTINNMTSALGQTGNLNMNQYNPGMMLNQAGGQIQQQAQNMIGANQNQYAYYQQLPYSNLSQYNANISGLPLGTQNQTPYYTNPMGSALSGAAAGATIGSAFPGYGTAIGAGVGGLAGLLGGGG